MSGTQVASGFEEIQCHTIKTWLWAKERPNRLLLDYGHHRFSNQFITEVLYERVSIFCSSSPYPQIPAQHQEQNPQQQVTLFFFL